LVFSQMSWKLVRTSWCVVTEARTIPFLTERKLHRMDFYLCCMYARNGNWTDISLLQECLILSFCGYPGISTILVSYKTESSKFRRIF
jgi:hypothetical protein